MNLEKGGNLIFVMLRSALYVMIMICNCLIGVRIVLEKDQIFIFLLADESAVLPAIF